VLVLISSAAGLQGAYGVAGYKSVLQKLNALAMPQSISVRILDDPSSMTGVAPARSQDPAALRAALNPIASALAPGSSIAIIGDQRVFPSFSVSNPVADRNIDPDSAVLTDNPYGDLTSSQTGDILQPAIPVGRIAAGVSSDAQDLSALLDFMSQRKSRPPLRAGYVEVTSRQWQNTSSFVLSALASSQKVFVSPDNRITASNASLLECKFLYCNLHGFPDDAAWMGYDQGLNYPVPAITPDAFQPQYVSGTVAFTEACYGLSTSGKSTGSSCALSLLAAGAAGVVGSTGLAFGTATVKPQNLVDADAMARGFFNTAIASGQSLGACLLAARNELVRSSVTNDAYVRKTLLSFQLLGDPSYVV
jgi:hypothetical protein